MGSAWPTDMPDDVLLSLGVGRVWEAFELTGWSPAKSPLRPHATVLRFDGDPDWAIIEAAIKDLEDRARWRMPSWRKALKAIRGAAEGQTSPTNRFKIIRVGDEQLIVAACLPSRTKSIPDVMSAVFAMQEEGVLAAAGVLCACRRYQR